MLTQYNKMAASAGSARPTQSSGGWTNVPAQRQDEVAVVISDREVAGGQNVPSAPAEERSA